MSKKVDTWYSLNLGDEQEAYQALAKIKQTFTPFFLAASGPPEMIVFYEDHPKTHVLTVYFSPATYEVAMLFNATPCAKPSRHSLVILLGDQRAWGIFYPTTE